jgi:hypothetical protein
VQVPLAELRASHVETWVKSMQDKGLEPRTIRTRFLRKEVHVARQVQWTDDGRMEIRAPKYAPQAHRLHPGPSRHPARRTRPPLPAW